MGFEWLPGQFSILIGGVEPFEVMQLLEGPGRRWPRRMLGPHGIPLVGIYGRTAKGRPLVVFVRHADGLDWLIVGARPMTPGEADEFAKWEVEQ